MERNLDYYKSILKFTTTSEMEVTSLVDYINAIMAINSFYRKVLFRGQANKSWEIESSAYRALNKSAQPPTQKLLSDYHISLLREVDNLEDVEKHKGITMLAHLQHNGAKTNLIDYSLNPLVCLHFRERRRWCGLLH